MAEPSAFGQMGTSIVVDDGQGNLLEVRANGTIGAHADRDHFMRNLGGYVNDVTDQASAAKAVAVVLALPKPLALPGLTPPA